jgi:hypothetical protein
MNRPGNLYAGTISTIAGLPVKGAIWHQGYNDALQPNGHKLYAAVFPEMIKASRSQVRTGDFNRRKPNGWTRMKGKVNRIGNAPTSSFLAS